MTDADRAAKFAVQILKRLKLGIAVWPLWLLEKLAHLKTGLVIRACQFRVEMEIQTVSGKYGCTVAEDENVPFLVLKILLFQAFSTFEWVLSQSKKLSFFGPFFQLKRAKRKNWNRTIFPLSVEVFKNCPTIRTLLPTKKQPSILASSKKCKNETL